MLMSGNIQVLKHPLVCAQSAKKINHTSFLYRLLTDDC